MRVILLALLLLVGTSAQAEAVRVAESGGAVLYVDPATIRTNGNLRQAWVIEDYAEPRAEGIRSRRVLLEFDCVVERWRSLSSTGHSEPMGGGKILVSRDDASEWTFNPPRTGSNIPPRTPNRTIRTFVCSR